MSKTEMISVPREVAEAAWQALDDDDRFEESCPLREALDLPAEQHQGEPVAEYQSRTRSADRQGNEGWSPWERCSEANYADYVRVPLLHGWEYQARKLYTHADPGEVERLRTIVEQQKNLIASLRAELVESRSIDANAEPSAPVERDELRDLLQSMTFAYRSAIQVGYDRITALGGDCDSVDKMLADFPDYAKARAALARKP